MSNSQTPIIIGPIFDVNIPEQKSQKTEDERKLQEQKERREAQQAAREKLMNKVNVDRKEIQSKELQEAEKKTQEKKTQEKQALAIKNRQDQERKERLLREEEEKTIMEEEKAYQLRLSKRPKQMKMSKFHYGTSDVNTIKIQFKTTDNDNIYELSINKNEPIKTLIRYIKHIISYIFDIQLIINGNELDCNLNIRIDYCGIKNDDMIIVNKIPNDDRTIMNAIYQKIISKNYDLSILNLYDTVFIKEFIIFIEKLKTPNKRILQKLLKNFTNNKIGITYNHAYLSGVMSVYKLQKNDMTVYLFGEQHYARNACQNLEIKSTYVEDFFNEVIDKSSVFIDFYIELPIKDFNFELPIDKSGVNLHQLGRNLYNNPNFGRGETSIARLHMIDVRQTNPKLTLNEESNIDKFINDINIIYVTSIEKPLNEENRHIYERLFGNMIKNKFFKVLTKRISDGTIKNYGDIFDLLTDDIKSSNSNNNFKQSYYRKELGRSKFNNNMNKFLSDYKEIVLDDLNDITINITLFEDFAKWIKPLYEILKDTDDLDLIKDSFISEKLSGIFYLNANVMDMYTLSRIFKDFDLDKNIVNRINPQSPKNIIVYAGQAHIDNYLVYLRDYEKFDVVEIIEQQQKCYDTYKILDILKSDLLNNIKVLKKLGIDVINEIGLKQDFESFFGGIDISLIDDDDLNIEIYTFLKQYFEFIYSYVDSLNDNIKKYLIDNFCISLDETSCLDIRTLRQPLFGS
jgi:hypothetical protein